MTQAQIDLSRFNKFDELEELEECLEIKNQEVYKLLKDERYYKRRIEQLENDTLVHIENIDILKLKLKKYDILKMELEKEKKYSEILKDNFEKDTLLLLKEKDDIKLELDILKCKPKEYLQTGNIFDNLKKSIIFEDEIDDFIFFQSDKSFKRKLSQPNKPRKKK